jgi:hypothetical protein
VTENQLLDFDATDFRIMRALSEDGRMSDVMLGERVHLSSTAAARAARSWKSAAPLPATPPNWICRCWGWALW